MVCPRLSSLNLFAASPGGGLRSAVVGAVTVAVILALAVAQPAQAQTGRPITFDIPAQDASSALLQLCLASDCELAFTPRPGPSVHTKAVRGTMPWRTALAQMLDGTDLRYRFVGARGVRVWVATSAPSPPPPQQAPPVEVLSLIHI